MFFQIVKENYLLLQYLFKYIISIIYLINLFFFIKILAVVAQIFLEEKEESDVVYVTWRQICFIVDLLCCGAIIIPIVW